MLWLIFWIALAVLFCGLCSLLEATFLSVRTPSLLYLAQHGNAGAAALLDIRSKRSADAISAILIINTFAGMVGASFAGAAVSNLWGESYVAWVSLALTIFMLFASEIGPKTFAAAHADRLAGWTGRMLTALIRLMGPVLPVTRAFTQWLAGDASVAVTRHGLAAAIAAAPLEGALSTPESELLTHIVYVHGVTLAEINTPLALVVMVQDSTTVAELLANEEADAFSRIPVYRNQREELVGYVSQRDVLKHVAAGGRRDSKLAEFLRPLPRLSVGLTLRGATDQLLRAREAIAAVIGPDGRAVGIVTLEDLLETLTGIEITDEAAEVAALRPIAEQARRRRIAALRQHEREWTAGPDENDQAKDHA